MKYKEAYDKIITAYFKDEIKPFEPEFCFCGNLNDNNPNWGRFTFDKNSFYSVMEYDEMEAALFDGMKELLPEVGKSIHVDDELDVRYEDCIFNGMQKALDVLKQIHISRGEIIDEPIEFKKRELLQS